MVISTYRVKFLPKLAGSFHAVGGGLSALSASSTPSSFDFGLLRASSASRRLGGELGFSLVGYAGLGRASCWWASAWRECATRRESSAHVAGQLTGWLLPTEEQPRCLSVLSAAAGSALPLLPPQRAHRIDPRSSPRRDVACQRCHGRDSQRSGGQRKQVGGLNPE